MVTTKNDLIALAVKMHNDLNKVRDSLGKPTREHSRWLSVAAAVELIELDDLSDDCEYSFREINEHCEMIIKHRTVWSESEKIYRFIEEEDVIAIEVI